MCCKSILGICNILHTILKYSKRIYIKVLAINFFCGMIRNVLEAHLLFLIVIKIFL